LASFVGWPGLAIVVPPVGKVSSIQTVSASVARGRGSTVPGSGVPPLAAVGYRNHPLQSRVETTYGYNPLELAGYAADPGTRLLIARLLTVDGQLLASLHAMAGKAVGQGLPNPMSTDDAGAALDQLIGPPLVEQPAVAGEHGADAAAAESRNGLEAVRP